MWEWLQENGWAGWSAAAILLAIVETLSLDLVFIMLAGGAAAGGVAALAGADFVIAALIAIATSLALLGVVRPIAKRHLTQGPTVRTGVDALAGRRAQVLETVTATAGQIRLSGEIWTARSYDGTTEIEVGRQVDVVEISGATAMVFPADDGPPSLPA